MTASSLSSCLRHVLLNPGVSLIEEGKPSEGLYLLLEGELEVRKVDAAGDNVVLTYLREGEVAGEISSARRWT